MNAFEYAHKCLDTDVRAFATRHDLGAEFRATPYDQILFCANLRILASRAIECGDTYEWSAKDVSRLLEVIRSDDTVKRGPAAVLLAILWAKDASAMLPRVVRELQNRNEDSQSPIFETKVELWLDCIQSKVKATLSELAWDV